MNNLNTRPLVLYAMIRTNVAKGDKKLAERYFVRVLQPGPELWPLDGETSETSRDKCSLPTETPWHPLCANVDPSNQVVISPCYVICNSIVSMLRYLFRYACVVVVTWRNDEIEISISILCLDLFIRYNLCLWSWSYFIAYFIASKFMLLHYKYFHDKIFKLKTTVHDAN